MSFFLSKDGGRKVGLGDNGSAKNMLLKGKYQVELIRHKEYGLGWRLRWSSSKGDHTDYFMDKPDMLQQEILAVEQRAKLRKQKQQTKRKVG